MGFRHDVRRQIRKRAANKSEISGRDDLPLECAHTNHDKKSPDYNCSDNGQLLTVAEHFYQHQMYGTTPEIDAEYVKKTTGLTPGQHRQAARLVWERYKKYRDEETTIFVES